MLPVPYYIVQYRSTDKLEGSETNPKLIESAIKSRKMGCGPALVTDGRVVQGLDCLTAMFVDQCFADEGSDACSDWGSDGALGDKRRDELSCGG